MKILKPTSISGHDGSSFREMLGIWKENNWCEVVDNTNLIQTGSDPTMWPSSRPWVSEVGDIMLYDNPILDKFHPGLTWKMALFCNEVCYDRPNCFSWTFWPNHPKSHEQIRKEGIPSYDERSNLSCFVGSYTTGYRNNFSQYRTHIQNFIMLGMNQRAMPQLEYLKYIKNHKFGLCLRGVGPKCLREMELIGFGTVPIFTPGVSTDYYNKLEKDRHYLYAERPEDIPTLISNCSKKRWEEMSQECLKWYGENATPRGCFELTQKIIQNNYGKNPL